MARSAVDDEYRRFLSDHPGHPLGRGMPLGSPLRIEFWHEASQSWRGESHLMAGERICRWDPCVYCGRSFSGTVDHIEPKSLPVRGLGSAFSWINVSGACSACNNAKARKPLLWFLWQRHRASAFRPARRVGSREIPDQEAA